MKYFFLRLTHPVTCQGLTYSVTHQRDEHKNDLLHFVLAVSSDRQDTYRVSIMFDVVCYDADPANIKVIESLIDTFITGRVISRMSTKNWDLCQNGSLLRTCTWMKCWYGTSNAVCCFLFLQVVVIVVIIVVVKY